MRVVHLVTLRARDWPPRVRQLSECLSPSVYCFSLSVMRTDVLRLGLCGCHALIFRGHWPVLRTCEHDPPCSPYFDMTWHTYGE